MGRAVFNYSDRKIYKNMAQGSTNKLTDFDLEVSRGNVSGITALNKFGRNPDVDTAADEDVWSGGGTWVEPTAARIHALVSASANDTAAGTGARTIYIEGLDSSYNVQSETLSLNGVASVNTVNSYTMINRMYVATFGSGATNAGLITATAATDATITAQILAGFGQTLMAIYQVPNGYKLYINDISCDMNDITANTFIDILLLTKDYGTGGYRTRQYIQLQNSGTAFIQKFIVPPLQIPSKTIIKMRAANASSNNCDICASFNGHLVLG